MKKKLTIFFVCMFAFLGAFVGINFNAKSAYAATDYEITNTTRTNYDMDENLFKILQALVKQLNYNQTKPGFSTDLLTYGYKEYTHNENWDVNAEPYKSYIANRNVIYNDLANNTIDLTVGKNAKYDCLKNANLKPLTTLTGLNCMAMENIKTLTIKDADLEQVSSTDFESLSEVTTINMPNCGLTKFELNPEVKKLNKLDLSNNNLTQINLSTMADSFGTKPSVNLTNNKIASLQDINLGQGLFSKLILNFNLISKFSADDYANLSAKVVDSKELFVGIQTQNSFDSLVAGDKILVTNYLNNYVNELNVVASYFAGSTNDIKSKFYVDGQSNVICETVGQQEQEILYAPAGKIFFEFFEGDYSINLVEHPEFENRFVKVALKAPTYSLKVNDKLVTSTYHESDINVIFDINQDTNIPNLQDIFGQKGVKIYCGTASNMAEDSDSQLTVSRNGTFELAAKAEFDDVYSAITTVNVTRQNTSGIVLGVIIILFIFIIGVAVYCITNWVKNGAVVAPLNEKEIYGLKKKEERKYGRERENNKKPLDASLRKAWREKQNGADLSGQTVDTSYYNYNNTPDSTPEVYDEEYRRFAGSDFDDGYLNENLNETDNIEVLDQNVDEE